MSLFSEIAGTEGEARATLRDAVAAHVERICSSRRGALLLAPDYGVDDVTSLFHSFPMIDAWIAQLERAIARYEPRLRNVRAAAIVSESLDPTLRVEIHGDLWAGGHRAPARFTATLDSRLRLSVR